MWLKRHFHLFLSFLSSGNVVEKKETAKERGKRFFATTSFHAYSRFLDPGWLRAVAWIMLAMFFHAILFYSTYLLAREYLLSRTKSSSARGKKRSQVQTSHMAYWDTAYCTIIKALY